MWYHLFVDEWHEIQLKCHTIIEIGPCKNKYELDSLAEPQQKYLEGPSNPIHESFNIKEKMMI